MYYSLDRIRSGLSWRSKRYYSKFINVRGRNYCPCCQSRVMTSDWVHTKSQICPVCGSKRRHRLLETFLPKYTKVLQKDKTLLHIAPEQNVTELFLRHRAPQFITADLYEKNVMVKMNVTDIAFPDNSFDFVFCIHVFEHVVDDYKAMRECCRVLKPDGYALLLVPVYPQKTLEDFSVVDHKERLRLFGDEDHVRKYGDDYVQRLEESGFIVKLFGVKELFTMDQIVYFGLNADDTIYSGFKTEKGFKNINIRNTQFGH